MVVARLGRGFMSALKSNVGLVSGLNIQDIVTALITADKNAIQQVANRQTGFKTTQTALTTLSANLLGITSSISQLGQATNYSKFNAVSSDTAQLTVSARSGAVAGVSQAQVLSLAAAQQSISRGFTNSDTQAVGTAGKIVIARGGRVAPATRLDALNGGAGAQRGAIRITDKVGVGVDIDLGTAVTAEDVVSRINSASGLGVKAETRGDKFVLLDTTGSGTGSITVAEKDGGKTAADLGLLGTTSGTTLTGSSVYSVGANFRLDKLNDGNGLRLADNAADLRISLSDPAETKLSIDLNGAVALSDVVLRINTATGNDGKLTASVANGRLVLTDNTGGGGPSALVAENQNGSNALDVLGLGTTASGSVLTGKRLGAGLNSVLLRNLRGGEGIAVPGSISLTDRTGRTATLDLSQAESLDEVLTAVNTATDGGGARLSVTARLNSTGTGIELIETSGSTASALIVADVGGGTTAANLGIAGNVSANTLGGGNLRLRSVNETASLTTYRNGDAVRRGSFKITDSAGTEYSVTIPEAAKTIGDVLDRVNAVTGSAVTAKLSRTGDGFELVDNAGGAGSLKVEDIGGTTAADLRIAGTGTVGTDGKSFLNSRSAIVIDVLATDSLSTVAGKFNSARGGISASIFDDGSSFNPKRLVLTSSKTGTAGQFFVEEDGVGLGFSQRQGAKDALLRIGSGTDGLGSFLLTSTTNTFDNAAPGLDITAKAVGATATSVNVSRDTGKVVDLVRSFVGAYNDFVTKFGDLTKFDAEKNTRGPLQGSTNALRVRDSLGQSVTGATFGVAGGTHRSLASIGVTVDSAGKLQFDSTKLGLALSTNPEAVQEFFATDKTGFAVKLKATVESFTDPLTGKLTGETNALQASVDSLQRRIDQQAALLTSRQTRLFNRFYNLETTLSRLNSQQSSLSKLQNISSSSSSSS
jgi:flagellar hook-associated protein 2